MDKYTFDWDDADGDTVIEKYDSLYRLIERVMDDLAIKKSVIIAHTQTVTLFEVAHPDPWYIHSPTLVTIQNSNIEMEYSGRIINQSKSLFIDVFRDLGFPLNRLIVFTTRGDRHGIVELKNI